MQTVAQFIDSIDRLTACSKAELRRYVQTKEFGVRLGDVCDKLFKEALQEHPPAALNALQRTAVKRALRHPGEQLTRCNMCHL